MRSLSSTFSRSQILFMVVVSLLGCTALLIIAALIYSIFIGSRSGGNREDTIATAAEVGAISLGTGRVYDLAFSPDGQTLAAGTGNGVWLYDMAGESEPRHLATGGTDSIAWSPDGAQVAVTDYNGIRILDTATGAVVRQFAEDGSFRSEITWSPNGEWIAYAVLPGIYQTDDIVVLSVDDGKVVTRLEEFDHVDGLGWSADGNFLVTATAPFYMDRSFFRYERVERDSALVWDVANNRQVNTSLTESDGMPIVSEDTETFFVADQILQLQGDTLSAYFLPLPVEGEREVAWSPDKQWYVIPGSDLRQIIHSADSEESITLETRQIELYRSESVAWSPDGRTLATAGSFNSHIWLWAWDEGESKMVQRWGEGAAWVRDIAWSPDSQEIALFEQNGRITIWSVGERRVVRSFGRLTAGESSISWSPDGKFLVSHSDLMDSEGHTVDFWDARTGELVQSWEMRTAHLRWSPQGDRIAGAGEDGVTVWDFESGTELFATSVRANIQDLQWSPDGAQIGAAIGRIDEQPDDIISTGHLVILDASTGEIINEFDSPYQDGWARGVAFSPRDSLVAGYLDAGLMREMLSGGAVVVWDFTDNRQLFTATGLVMSDSELAWSPDGELLVSGSHGDLALFAPFQDKTLLFEADGVDAVAWSPDGEWIATGSYDGSLILWPAEAVRAYLPLVEGK